MSRAATKEAFYIVGETCPAVDAALDRIRESIDEISYAQIDALADADELIKKQTDALRRALIEALERAIEAEAKVTKLESEIDDLQNEIVELEKELADV